MENATTDLRTLTPRELAERSGIGANRIRAAIRTGELTAFHVGTWARVKPRDFLLWLESQRVRPTSHAQQCVDQILEREAQTVE